MNPADVTKTESMQAPGDVKPGISQLEERGHDKDSLVLPDHSAILQVQDVQFFCIAVTICYC